MKRKKVTEQPSTPFNPRAYAGSAFLLIATFLAYLPAIRAGFIWDDPDYVIGNHTLRTLDGLREMWLVPTSLPQWYPLVHTTFWIEYHLVGTNPTLYHIDNILLHAISAILLWRLLSKLEVKGAFFAACVFALHPVMVESVAWVTERKNVLSLVFYLLAMHVYLFRFAPTNSDGEEPDWRSYALALVFFLCALFSKTVTASLPAAILLILWWKHGRLRLRGILPLIPFFVAGLAMGAVTGWLERHHVGASEDVTPELKLSLVQRSLIAGRVIWFYLGKLIYPHPLAFIYPRWNEIDHPSAWQWVFPAMVIVTTVGLWALRKKIGRGVLVAWLLFCGTLVPALSFVNVFPMRYSFVADHFQYHAAIAMIVLFVSMTSYLSPRMRGAIWGMIIVVLGCTTFARARAYNDAETLWRDTLVKNPNSWMVYTNLGNVLATQGRYDESIPYHERALELAPQLHETHWNYGVGLMRENRIDEAEAEFNKSLEINPKWFFGYESLGELYYYHRHDTARAIEYYKQALQIAPTFPKANYYYGVALEQQANQLKERFEQSKDQKDFEAWLAKLNEAISHYRDVVMEDPDYLEAHYNLANCLMQLRQFDEAIVHLREALRINPNDADAWTNLGNAYFQTGRFGEAATAFQRALLIKPDLQPARRGLQAARARLQG